MAAHPMRTREGRLLAESLAHHGKSGWEIKSATYSAIAARALAGAPTSPGVLAWLPRCHPE